MTPEQLTDPQAMERYAAAQQAVSAFIIRATQEAVPTNETAQNWREVQAQIEGSVLWGMSLALFEKAPLKDGGLQVSNFNDYTPLRMSQMPDIDVSIIANNDPPSGCGEPGVTVVAPAIANAIFNAVGARVRSLPITAEAVKAAMKT